MTEKEKMLAGMLYEAAHDEETDREHQYYYDLCHDFNHCRPSDRGKQFEILDKILGKHGKYPMAFGPIEIDLGYNVSVGDYFFMNHGTVMLATNKISFGDNVLCAGNYLLWCLDAFLRVQITPGNLCQRRCSSLGLYDVGHGLQSRLAGYLCPCAALLLVGEVEVFERGGVPALCDA